MSASNFPTKNISLNSYFDVVLKYMTANKVRLQIEQAKLDEFTNLYGDKTTPETWAYVSAQYFDETKHTKLVTTKLRNLKKQIKELLMAIYNDIPADIWTNDDRSIFQRKKGDRKTTYTQVVTPISEQCQVIPVQMGGGFMRFKCRTMHDSSRPSLAQGATGVEMAFKIADVTVETAENGSQKVTHHIGNWKEPEKATRKEISTRANFMKRLGFENIGRKCEYFARWVNLRKPRLNGPWTGPGNFTIL